MAHHVTQRGNARQYILNSDGERMVYLDLLRQSVQLHSLSVIGYCLMSNHVHLVVIPRKATAMAKALKEAHGRYATYWNAAHASSGHAWRGRFYSCPLDTAHLWEALRYAELNPVRAGLVAHAQEWKWSSAAAHCGTSEPDELLEMESVARELVGGELAGLSQRRRNGIRAGGDPAMYAHRPSPGNEGVRQGVGGNDASPTSAAQRWSSCEAGDGSKTGAAGVRLLECNS